VARYKELPFLKAYNLREDHTDFGRRWKMKVKVSWTVERRSKAEPTSAKMSRINSLPLSFLFFLLHLPVKQWSPYSWILINGVENRDSQSGKTAFQLCQEKCCRIAWAAWRAILCCAATAGIKQFSNSAVLYVAWHLAELYHSL